MRALIIVRLSASFPALPPRPTIATCSAPSTTTACSRPPGVTPADAQLRKQCSAAVIETDDPPEFFDCVYVQTEKDLNLFSLEDGYLMSELQLKLHNMDGVALQHMGRYSQVQIFSGDRVTALYIHGKSWIDPAADRRRVPVADRARRAGAPAAQVDRALIFFQRRA